MIMVELPLLNAFILVLITNKGFTSSVSL